MRSCRSVILALVVLTVGCNAPTASQSDGSAAPASQQPQRTLTAAVRVEPTTTASKSVRGGGVALFLTGRMFNAEIGLLNADGVAIPYLVEAFPQLNSDGWRIFPDGRMETIYRLKSNLTWHDGTPLTTEDFAFSWRVYSWPELGVTGAPINLMESVTARDPRTLVINWKQPFVEAGSLSDRGSFPPLPRHILEPSFTAGQAEPFASHLFWTTQYVGLGPFKMDRWEPGAFIEGSAYDAHVLGRPKVDRFVETFNTSLDRAERTGLLTDMARIYTEDLAAISLFFRTQPWVFNSTLTGPKLVPAETNMTWNIYEWELTR